MNVACSLKINAVIITAQTFLLGDAFHGCDP